MPRGAGRSVRVHGDEGIEGIGDGDGVGIARLSAREVDVLALLASGNPSGDIAGHLSISEQTVRVHFKHIREKLGANRSYCNRATSRNH